MHSKVPPADEMPHVGHGDKVKREAGELVEDVKIEKGERYDGDRDRERERRHRHRDEEGGDRYEKHER
jgi:RNA-binding protein Luc7-like 2